VNDVKQRTGLAQAGDRVRHIRSSATAARSCAKTGQEQQAAPAPWCHGHFTGRPVAHKLQTAVVSGAKHRVKAHVDGRPVDFHPYHGRSGWLKELERLITDLRRDNVPPGRISVLLLKTPSPGPSSPASKA